MKRSLFAAIVLLFCIAGAQAQDASAEKRNFNMFEGTTWWTECIEWGGIVSVFILSEEVLHDMPPWAPTPMLPTTFKYWDESEPRVQDIKTKYFYDVGIALGTGILLLPNSEGFLNHNSYRHFKGFFEANLSLIPFITSLVRHSLPKYKPSYDQTVMEGGTVKLSDSMSFWSADAASAFGMATYASLFVMNNLGQGGKEELWWKLPIVLALGGTAFYVSSNVVSSHSGDILDVLVGASAGALLSAAVYCLHENLLGTSKNSRNMIEYKP